MVEWRTIDTDLAMIGSGGAGLMCVLHAHAANPELDITVVSKGAVGRSGCTRMVQAATTRSSMPPTRSTPTSTTPWPAANSSMTRSWPGPWSTTHPG